MKALDRVARPGAVERESVVRLLIRPPSPLVESADLLGALPQGSFFALDSGKDLADGDVEPHDDPRRFHQESIGFRYESAASGRDHGLLRLFYQLEECFGLAAAESVLSLSRENLGDAHPGRSLDALVEIDESEAHPFRHLTSERGLARAHESYEEEALGRLRGL